jgi:hypothetical protein
MADFESKEIGAHDRNLKEMYHEGGNERSSDEHKAESEAVDAGDMYRMGKDQQFRVSACEERQ